MRPVVFVLVLRTQLVNAIAFLAGWTLALSVLFVIVFVWFAGGISTVPPPARTTASVARSRWGGAARGRGRPVASPPRRERSGGYPPAVLQRLDHLDVRRAAVIGVLIQPAALTVAAAVVIARDRSGVLSLLVGFALFAVVSTAALVGILAYDLWRPESARAPVDRCSLTLERQGPSIFTVLCGAGGGYFVLDGLRDLLL